MMPWTVNYTWENLTTVGKTIAEIWYVPFTKAIHKCPPMKVDPLPRLRHTCTCTVSSALGVKCLTLYHNSTV